MRLVSWSQYRIAQRFQGIGSRDRLKIGMNDAHKGTSHICAYEYILSYHTHARILHSRRHMWSFRSGGNWGHDGIRRRGYDIHRCRRDSKHQRTCNISIRIHHVNHNLVFIIVFLLLSHPKQHPKHHPKHHQHLDCQLSIRVRCLHCHAPPRNILLLPLAPEHRSRHTS
jgi:hypothetical protein